MTSNFIVFDLRLCTSPTRTTVVCLLCTLSCQFLTLSRIACCYLRCCLLLNLLCLQNDGWLLAIDTFSFPQFSACWIEATLSIHLSRPSHLTDCLPLLSNSLPEAKIKIAASKMCQYFDVPVRASGCGAEIQHIVVYRYYILCSKPKTVGLQRHCSDEFASMCPALFGSSRVNARCPTCLDPRLTTVVKYFG